MSNDPLAQLNDHFARFLQHADGLLREWRSAIDEQTKQVQSRVAREVDGHLDQAVGDSLARLRDQIDQLTRASGGARVRGARSPGGPAGAVDPPDGPRRSWLLAALVSANVMLALVLGLSIKSCADSGRDTGALAGTTAPIATGPDAGQVVAPVGATPDAGASADAGPSATAAMCETLATEPTAEAARAFVEAAAAECGDDAGKVADAVAGALADGDDGKGKSTKPKSKSKPKPKSKSKKKPAK
jgi:hypothetical protein